MIFRALVPLKSDPDCSPAPGQVTAASTSLTGPRGEARLLKVVVLDLTVPSISHLLSCKAKPLQTTQQQSEPTPYSFHLPLAPKHPPLS